MKPISIRFQIFRLKYCKVYQNLILGNINIRNLKPIYVQQEFIA